MATDVDPISLVSYGAGDATQTLALFQNYWINVGACEKLVGDCEARRPRTDNDGCSLFLMCIVLHQQTNDLASSIQSLILPDNLSRRSLLLARKSQLSNSAPQPC